MMRCIGNTFNEECLELEEEGVIEDEAVEDIDSVEKTMRKIRNEFRKCFLE